MGNLEQVKVELKSKMNMDHVHLASANDGNHVLVGAKFQGNVKYTLFDDCGIVEEWEEKLN